MIEVHNLSKSFRIRTGGFLSSQYREVRAVQDVSFAVGRGEVVGYLGSNGAGKSTTIKMLCGLLVPTAGRVEVAGRVPWRERQAHVACLGAVFGQRTTLWWDLPVRDSLELLRDIYGVRPTRYRENLATFTELLDLGPFLDTPARSLSLGQRMRADLAAALLHDPALLLLDEPTVGLDVVAKERIREFVGRVNKEREVTVLLTTHDLGDVERLARRVMMIDAGRLLFDGPLADLSARFGGKRTLVVDFETPPAHTQAEGLELLAQDGPRYSFGFGGSASRAIAAAASLGPVLDIRVQEPSLEGTVRRIYEEGLLDVNQTEPLTNATA